MIEGQAKPETNAPKPETSMSATRAFFALLGNPSAVERARLWARKQEKGATENRLAYAAGMYLMREAVATAVGGFAQLEALTAKGSAATPSEAAEGAPADAPAG